MIYDLSWILNAFDEGAKQGARMAWQVLISILVEHWIVVLIFLLLVLFIAIVEALLGRWGTLGKVSYHYLYFGILFIVGLIGGSDIFVSNLFSIFCTLMLYPLCYWITGRILVRTGFIRYTGRIRT